MDTIAKIKQIARANQEGFTLYLPSLEFVKHGWVIANSATQNFHGDEGLQKAYEFAMNHNRIIGGWYDENSGLFYWDAVIVEPDREKAIELMEMHDQIGIYNLDTAEYLERDGHY